MVAGMEVDTPARRPVYAARNALNAGQLKDGIVRRSLARGDDEPVRDWLCNHFYRHLVGNFEPVRQLLTLDDARTVLGAEPLPAWLLQRFDETGQGDDQGAAPLVWIDPGQPRVLALEARLVEFLSSRQGTALQGKLERINCPQALQLWEQEHARIQLRLGQGWRQSQPAALRPAVSCASHTLFELRPDSALLRAEMAFESYVMRHCLGQFANHQRLSGGYGQHYAEGVEHGRLRVFSLRDAQGQPHITISLIVRKDGALTVDQVKGKQNRPPVARYYQDLLQCLDALGTDDHSPDDCIAIGIVRTPSGWRLLEAVSDAADQTRLVARYPQLFRRLQAPKPMVQWLVAARQPELVAQGQGQVGAVSYATRHLSAQGAIDGHYSTEGIAWVGMSHELAAQIKAGQGRDS